MMRKIERKKAKGSLMIEVIFSIVLLGLVAATILNNLLSINKASEKLKSYNKLVDYGNSKMEELISQSYRGEDIYLNNSSEKSYSSEVEIENLSKFKRVILKARDNKNGKEIKFEVYLKDKGIFTN